jgi:hypothetical protein
MDEIRRSAVTALVKCQFGDTVLDHPCLRQCRAPTLSQTGAPSQQDSFAPIFETSQLTFPEQLLDVTHDGFKIGESGRRNPRLEGIANGSGSDGATDRTNRFRPLDCSSDGRVGFALRDRGLQLESFKMVVQCFLELPLAFICRCESRPEAVAQIDPRLASRPAPAIRILGPRTGFPTSRLDRRVEATPSSSPSRCVTTLSSPACSKIPR